VEKGKATSNPAYSAVSREPRKRKKKKGTWVLSAAEFLEKGATYNYLGGIQDRGGGGGYKYPPPVSLELSIWIITETNESRTQTKCSSRYQGGEGREV